VPAQDTMRFGVQVAFSSIVLFFCLFKLMSPNDNQSNALYWGGVTSVLAWWMPSPGGGTSRNSASIKADEVNAVHIEKLESMPQMNGSKN
jgi:hypothetical protein